MQSKDSPTSPVAPSEIAPWTALGLELKGRNEDKYFVIFDRKIEGGEYSTNEVTAFIADWESKGIYIEVIEANEKGGYFRVQITNSPVPMEGMSGVWFEAWSRNVQAVRDRVKSELERDFPDNTGLSGLQEAGFNPGMWTDNKGRNHFLSHHAREILIANSGLVLEILSLYGDRTRKEDIAEAIVPATIGRLDGHLNSEHLTALVESLRNIGPIVREHLSARILPAVIEAIGPENCTPRVIEETSEQVNLLAVSIAHAFVSKLFPSKPAQENVAALVNPQEFFSSLLADSPPFNLDDDQRRALYDARDIIDKIGRRHVPYFISSLGKAYDPYYIGLFADKVGSFGKDIPELISHVGSALVGAEENPIPINEFDLCLTHIQKLYNASGSVEFHPMAYWILPRMIGNLDRRGELISEAIEKITVQLARIPAEFQNPNSVLNMMLKNLASSFNKDNPINVDDVKGYIDEFLLIEKRFKNHASGVIYHILPAFMNRQPNLNPKLLCEFREALETALEFSAEDQGKVFSVDRTHSNPLATLLNKAGEPFDRNSFDKYLESIRSANPIALEALTLIARSVKRCDNLVGNPTTEEEYKFKGDDVPQLFEVANRISRSLSGVPSRVPIKIIGSIIGRFQHVNDWKTCDEALALARQYADFLEANSDEVMRICDKNPNDYQDDVKQQFNETNTQTKHLIDLYIKSGGRGTDTNYFPSESVFQSKQFS